MSDEELITKIRTKDKELYAEIIRRYEAKLLRYANYLINDKDKAADIVQEAFIKAYINLNGFEVKKKFSSWIYRIVHNQAVNFIKKNKKEVPLIEAIDLSGGKNVEIDFEKKGDDKNGTQLFRTNSNYLF
ncbi:MAG: RNA polymerase sigma-70 factor, ECF subfamily [Candidatus Roizmanbacteria bacterium GW2011_GWC1_37_12]|nr:MAG: RNA polymerase sigma-70 factor, ECF subfamily [Candidatus Roizmanbacteria bacterium GW2011_GWC1_37_12]